MGTKQLFACFQIWKEAVCRLLHISQYRAETAAAVPLRSTIYNNSSGAEIELFSFVSLSSLPKVFLPKKIEIQTSRDH